MRGGGVLVGLLAVLVSRRRVLLGLFVLADCVMVLGLMMVVRRRAVMRGRLMVMLTGRMFGRLSHCDEYLLECDRSGGPLGLLCVGP